MCGLIGMVSKNINTRFTDENIESLESAMFWNQRRGTHSSGLGFLSRKPDGHSGYLKNVGSFVSLSGDSQYEGTLKEIKEDCVAVIGHGRSATIGKVIISNAHPFKVEFGDRAIILAHNGTLYHKQKLPDWEKYDVDSEWLAAMIVRYGAEEAIHNIEGAMALLWVDLKDRSFNAYHNRERPLCWFTDNEGLMYLSSTQDILEAIAFRTRTQVTTKNCLEISDDILCKWMPDKDGEWKLTETKVRSASTVYYPPPIPKNDYSGNYDLASYDARIRDNVTKREDKAVEKTVVEKPVVVRHRKSRIVAIGSHVSMSKVGAKVLVEAVETSDMMQIQSAQNKVYSVRASGPIEDYLDYIFYTPLTTSEVMKIKYFTGEIGAIVAVPGSTPTAYEAYLKDVHATTDAEILAECS